MWNITEVNAGTAIYYSRVSSVMFLTGPAGAILLQHDTSTCPIYDLKNREGPLAFNQIDELSSPRLRSEKPYLPSTMIILFLLILCIAPNRRVRWEPTHSHQTCTHTHAHYSETPMRPGTCRSTFEFCRTHMK